MTKDEIKAKEFAIKSKKAQEINEARKKAIEEAKQMAKLLMKKNLMHI